MERVDSTSSGSGSETFRYEKKECIELRRRIQQLYFDRGLSKNEVVRRLNVSKGFVVNWTQEPRRSPEEDRRGWQKGKHRTYDPVIVDRVLQLHAKLVADEEEFFAGATSIELAWRARYPDEEIPSLRYIGKILSAQGLTKPHRGRQKGALRRLCYPEETLYRLVGNRLLESDFLGQRFLRGGEGPLNFIGFCFKKEPRLRWYYRVEAQNTEAILTSSADFFERFELPAAIKVDNAAAMHGSASAKRCLSRFHHQMLSQQVIPIHSVPRIPSTQASIEGNNSVFSRFFWNRREHGSIEEVDERLPWFNDSSARYLRYERPTGPRLITESWSPMIYFLRQVRQDPDTRRAFISVTNERIELDPKLISYFVLAQWQLENSTLNIILEKEQGTETIASVPLEINEKSKYQI